MNSSRVLSKLKLCSSERRTVDSPKSSGDNSFVTRLILLRRPRTHSQLKCRARVNIFHIALRMRQYQPIGIVKAFCRFGVKTFPSSPCSAKGGGGGALSGLTLSFVFSVKVARRKHKYSWTQLSLMNWISKRNRHRKCLHEGNKLGVGMERQKIMIRTVTTLNHAKLWQQTLQA